MTNNRNDNRNNETHNTLNFDDSDEYLFSYEPTVMIKLKQILVERNMTQKELSELTGIREATLSMIIRNATNKINYNHLATIMIKLGIEDFNKILKLKR